MAISYLEGRFKYLQQNEELRISVNNAHTNTGSKVVLEEHEAQAFLDYFKLVCIHNCGTILSRSMNPKTRKMEDLIFRE